MSALNPNPELPGLGRLALMLSNNTCLQAQLGCRKLEREVVGVTWEAVLPSENPTVFF